MKVFKKRMKKLQARQRGCVETREFARRRNAKIKVEEAYRMPGSLRK